MLTQSLVSGRQSTRSNPAPGRATQPDERLAGTGVLGRTPRPPASPGPTIDLATRRPSIYQRSYALALDALYVSPPTAF